MTTLTFKIILISLLILEFLTTYTLKILNINFSIKNRKTIPEIFRACISEENYQKSINYTQTRDRFSLITTFINLIITLILLFTGFLGTLEKWISLAGLSTFFTGVLFIVVVSFLLYIVTLPLSLYSTFVIEEEFGFNKTSLKTYIIDTVKGGVISVIIGAIVLIALYKFYDITGSGWWIWATIFFTLFQLFLSLIYPSVIAPIFNKFTPLEDGDLKEKLNSLAKKADFPVKGIYVMDGSKRSSHSNAYFTGFGNSRRIVLYDTLIESLTIDELYGVLAHEIGHWKRGHIRKRLILSFITMPIVFFILSIALNFPPLYHAFSLESGSLHGLIIIFSLVSTAFTFLLTPISSHFSRKDEYEADNFAKEITGTSQDLTGALLKLSRDNLSNLTPHPAYSGYYYSHPPVIDRVKKLQKNA